MNDNIIRYNGNNNTFILNGEKFKTGDNISCTISDHNINDAKIYINKYEEYFICHNNRVYNGSTSPNKLGYKYSWFFSYISDKDKNEVFNLKKVKINIYDNILDKAFNNEKKI
jgi:hypothetical protein